MDLRQSKIRLKSYCVEFGYEKPVYETVSKRDENFRKLYKVRVTIDGLIDTVGEGMSKRLAEYKAAVNALQEIHEVKEEQKKTKVFVLNKDKNVNQNDLNGNNDVDVEVEEEKDNEDVETNGGNQIKITNEENKNDIKLNDDQNSDYNTTNNEANGTIDANSANGTNHSNTISVEAEVTATGAEELDNSQSNVQQNEDQIESTLNNSNNTENTDNNQQNAENDNNKDKTRQSMQINGKTNGTEVTANGTDDSSNGSKDTPKRNGSTFARLDKNSIQLLMEFCMKQQTALPFYDSTFRDSSFRIKCRIEFNVDEEKREFFGNGFGDSLKAAKLMAAEDVIKQLKDLQWM